MRDLVIVTYAGVPINDRVNYIAGFATGQEWGLSPVSVRTVKRSRAWPVLGSVDRPAPVFTIVIKIIGPNVRALRDQLLRLFDPEDENIKWLIVHDASGSEWRYVETVCERLQPVAVGGNAAVDTFMATVVVVNDPRWRSTATTTHTWNITASGQTVTITNTGTSDAYPIIRIKPTLPKTVGYAYRRFVAVAWRSPNAGPTHPILVTLDTQTLISEGKMRADGNDLRVMVNGVEVDRWIADMNSFGTDIWFLLDFQPSVAMTLKTAIASSGSITTINVNEPIDRMPESGMVIIDNEVFTYTGRSVNNRQFTGVTRAAKGTAAAAHSVGTSVHWVQHEVWLLYGNPAASTPPANPARSPVFNLSLSHNAYWYYTQFGDMSEQRPGTWRRWGPLTVSGSGGCYTVTERGGVSSPYEVVGAWTSGMTNEQYGWYLYHPCKIDEMDLLNGKRRRASGHFEALWLYLPRGETNWNGGYIQPPSATNVWEPLSLYLTPSKVTDTFGFKLYSRPSHPSDIEFGAAAVYISIREYPYVVVGNEMSTYDLNASIANDTSYEYIRLSFAMSVNQELEIDCYNRTVTYLADNSRQLAALTVSAGQRHWMRLVPGNNTLRYVDQGTTGVTMTIQYRRRFY